MMDMSTLSALISQMQGAGPGYDPLQAVSAAHLGASGGLLDPSRYASNQQGSEMVDLLRRELDRQAEMDAYGMLGGGLSQFVSGLDQVGGDYLTNFWQPQRAQVQLGQVNNPGISLLLAMLAPAMRGGY